LLEVSWNDLSPNIMAAQSGSLTIEDGFGRKTIRLDAAQLRNKRIFYAPVSSDVNIRLEVVGGNRRSAEESVRFGQPESIASARSTYTRCESRRSKRVSQQRGEAASCTARRQTGSERLSRPNGRYFVDF
jgi:hypothetical protein